MIGRSGLTAELRALGIPGGATLLVHCAMSRIGPVAGGPATLLAALLDVLGETGTVVVPAQTPGNSVTSRAFLAATAGLTAEQTAAVEARIPPFDPANSPSEGMGALAEHLRQHDGAVRSRHPQASFAALGADAAAVTAVHDLGCHLGERSPLGALYAADALVLLLGVDYFACAALHLAEYRRRRPAPQRAFRAYLLDHQGRRVRRDFRALDLDDTDFPLIGRALDDMSFVRIGRVGGGLCRLIRMRPAVDYAGRWMDEHREP
ncbi:AAC(3) family N-acetyltransferase [Plantactinospora sp. S1510]|uniref:Aminoglycoside N(3)-acetyltransferase n=1 Tax=Plantactinospora alkalitolerans TaxID=2789879 RepID=A0ABS0GU29_9ACTN|nr:AAC(3) family N-acetyltransferase [Plantactinospora alkalitolerans]MBF9129554.1 AAC(3) family N-acetyltransferase [Plantactinospora alkalitolerans]